MGNGRVARQAENPPPPNAPHYYTHESTATCEGGT